MTYCSSYNAIIPSEQLAKTGFTVVDDDVLRVRQEACKRCPHLANLPKKLFYKLSSGGNTSRKIGSFCGCLLFRNF